jgi:hypothetical protein
VSAVERHRQSCRIAQLATRPLQKLSGTAKIDVTVLVITIFRAGTPLTTKGTRKSRGSIANGVRAMKFARKCAKSTGNLNAAQDGANIGSVDTAAHTATVEMTYPSHPRFLPQADASIVDTKMDDATKPMQISTGS